MTKRVEGPGGKPPIEPSSKKAEQQKSQGGLLRRFFSGLNEIIAFPFQLFLSFFEGSKRPFVEELGAGDPHTMRYYDDHFSRYDLSIGRLHYRETIDATPKEINDIFETAKLTPKQKDSMVRSAARVESPLIEIFGRKMKSDTNLFGRASITSEYEGEDKVKITVSRGDIEATYTYRRPTDELEMWKTLQEAKLEFIKEYYYDYKKI